MDQLIFEYHVLRQVICDVIEEECELSALEREIIVAAVEQAVNDAATEFSETLRDIQERLTSTLAHDLRGPITAAKTSAQLLLRRPDDVDHCVRTAARISNNMDRLDSMIHDLLDASRIRAGQGLSLQIGECDLDLIVRQVADEMNEIHGERFVVKSRGHCVGFWSANGMRRLLENLTTNAAKFSTAGTPITLSVTQSTDTAGFSVHNLGKVIPSEEQAILFQQYRRTRNAEARTGWGLGLTVVKGMAEAHHGTIQVESEEGKGTTFSVQLPKDSRPLETKTPHPT
jgi:signal transduction histidine kinase